MKAQKAKQDPGSTDDEMDRVREASQESFPASDPPAWTPNTGEKRNDSKAESESKEGCVTSFLMDERGELGGICEEEPDPKEQYVQPEKEKEAGGEG